MVARLTETNTMDDSISPGADNDTVSSNVELPVNIDTLHVGGIAPDVGDMVKIIVKGSVTRTANETAWIKVETVNDQPYTAPAVDPDPLVSEGERLEKLSRSYGAIGSA